MALRKNWDDLDTGEKGDWYFIKKCSYIVLRFGDTMEDTVILPLQGEGAWNWNGDKESPTLTPSILVHGSQGQQDKWHGFLTNGKLVSA
jgi:hypothetical protein